MLSTVAFSPMMARLAAVRTRWGMSSCRLALIQSILSYTFFSEGHRFVARILGVSVEDALLIAEGVTMTHDDEVTFVKV